MDLLIGETRALKLQLQEELVVQIHLLQEYWNEASRRRVDSLDDAEDHSKEPLAIEGESCRRALAAVVVVRGH